MRSRLEPVTTNPLTQKGPALGRASKSFAQSASGLGGAARLIGVALSLLMLRAASSAMRTDTSAMRLLVSITCCRPSRTRSL